MTVKVLKGGQLDPYISTVSLRVAKWQDNKSTLSYKFALLIKDKFEKAILCHRLGMRFGQILRPTGLSILFQTGS